MPSKHHAMYQAPAGAVFAVAIEPGRWGIVRFFRGRVMGVLDIVSRTSTLPSLDWKNPPIRWVFFSFAPDGDTTEAIALGIVPFSEPDSEWGPPCFDPPDVIQNCYSIHHRGGITKTKDESEIAGMTRCQTMKPADLVEFLRERLNRGELRPVQIVDAVPAPNKTPQTTRTFGPRV